MNYAGLFTFTVFTPTYNRAHTLPRVWRSLRQQTFRDFEWVIVDDGSTDGTDVLVSRWIANSLFPIRYLRQSHGHKKTAANLAAREARGRLLLPLDSDDECVPGALERLHWHWENIPEDQRDRFSAVTALCVYPDGRIVGDRFPCVDWLDSDSVEVFHRWSVAGEKWGFQRTDVMRRFPFPEDCAGYVPESVVWDRIARYYKTRYVNEALRIYHESPDGITRRTSPSFQNSAGHALWMSEILSNQWPFFRYKPVWFVRCSINYTRFRLHSNQADVPKSRPFAAGAAMLIATMRPLGYLAYASDRLGLARRQRRIIQALRQFARGTHEAGQSFQN